MFSLWSVVTKHANILSPRFKTFLALTKIAARFWCTIWSTYLHLAQCFNLSSRENGCDKDEECGFNEYCTTLLSGLVGGQCRTKLSDGSLCVRFGLVFSLLAIFRALKKNPRSDKIFLINFSEVRSVLTLVPVVCARLAVKTRSVRVARLDSLSTKTQLKLKGS